jgi:hypothetical protein
VKIDSDGHALEGDVEAEEDGHGRGEGRLAFGLGVAVLAEVEVEAGHAGSLVGLPGTVAHGGEGKAGGNHPALLGAGDDDVEGPGVHLQRDGAEAADGVDDEELVELADDFCDLGEWVGDAGGGFVVGDGDGLDGGGFLEGVADVVGAGGLPPFVGEHRHVGAVGLGDGGEALAEGADADGEDSVPGGEDVDDG